MDRDEVSRVSKGSYQTEVFDGAKGKIPNGEKDSSVEWFPSRHCGCSIVEGLQEKIGYPFVWNGIMVLGRELEKKTSKVPVILYF